MQTYQRTGVRLVLSNNTDPSRPNDFHEWYDLYASHILFPGLLVNCFRFEDTSAAGTEDDPRYAAVYDFVTPELKTAWPRTADHPAYPKHLFDDPRFSLVTAPFRATYELIQSRARPGKHGALTGVVLVLADGTQDSAYERWTNGALETGLFA